MVFLLFLSRLAAAPGGDAPIVAVDARIKGWQAVVEGNGLSIASTGMLIVFFALVIISLFIRLLPEVLKVMEPILPKLGTHTQPPTLAEQLPSDKEKVVAAIGYVLHMEMEKATQTK